MKIRLAKKIMSAKRNTYWNGKFNLYCMWSRTLNEKGIRDHRITKAIRLTSKCKAKKEIDKAF